MSDLPVAVRANPKIPLAVVHEDAQVLVVDKPAGLVTQPGKGHANDTLLNGVFAHRGGGGTGEPLEKFLRNLGARRDFGLLHRLDKETSGLLVIAKTPNAYDQLRRDFEARRVDKDYLAITAGIPVPPRGVVQARLKEVELPNPEARGKYASIKKAVISRQGQEAVSAYTVLSHDDDRAKNAPAALVQITIKTGRLHQIRAHMLFLHCHVLGDSLYLPPDTAPALKNYPHPPRLCLHATRLGFKHPETAKWVHFTSPLPPDLARYAAKLHLRGAE